MEKTFEQSYKKDAPLICVVDDDESMRVALQSLLKSVGFRTAIFASANEFLNSNVISETDCLILDVRMPEMNGLELQQKLVAENSRVPIIFISAHSEASEKAQAISAGAIDFYTNHLAKMRCSARSRQRLNRRLFKKFGR